MMLGSVLNASLTYFFVSETEYFVFGVIQKYVNASVTSFRERSFLILNQSIGR